MVKTRTKFSVMALLIGASAILAACANGSDGSAMDGQQISDPFEKSNRAVFAFNSTVDDAVIHPVVKGYRAVVPTPARNGFGNFLSHLRSPVRLGNQILQGDVSGAGNEIVRTTVNTFVGLGGIVDVAGYEGLELEQEDFGQTLAVWGLDHGPYLVVPFLGPSSLRDYVGYAVDTFADPLNMYWRNVDEAHWQYSRGGAQYLKLRDSLMDVLVDLEASSIDYYAAVRSTYYQNRAALVNDQNGSGASIPDYDDF